MKTPTLIKNYEKHSDAALSALAEAVIAGLTGNAHFTTTKPTLAEFTTTATNFANDLADAFGRDRTAIAIKNSSRDFLLQRMRQLATDIEAQSMGDKAWMLSSGFTLAKERGSVPAIGAPENFRLTEGPNPGEIISEVNGVSNARSYVHAITEDPITELSIWRTKASTSRKYKHTGLTPGTRIHAKVAAVGSRGQEVYTEILSKIVQG